MCVWEKRTLENVAATYAPDRASITVCRGRPKRQLASLPELLTLLVEEFVARVSNVILRRQESRLFKLANSWDVVEMRIDSFDELSSKA